MSIDPNLKKPKFGGIEKYLLRKSFDNNNLLPNKFYGVKKKECLMVFQIKVGIK